MVDAHTVWVTLVLEASFIGFKSWLVCYLAQNTFLSLLTFEWMVTTARHLLRAWEIMDIRNVLRTMWIWSTFWACSSCSARSHDVEEDVDFSFPLFEFFLWVRRRTSLLRKDSGGGQKGSSPGTGRRPRTAGTGTSEYVYVLRPIIHLYVFPPLISPWWRWNIPIFLVEGSRWPPRW